MLSGGCEGRIEQDFKKAKILCKAQYCGLNPADSTPRPNEFCVTVHCKNVFLDFRKAKRGVDP